MGGLQQPSKYCRNFRRVYDSRIPKASFIQCSKHRSFFLVVQLYQQVPALLPITVSNVVIHFFQGFNKNGSKIGVTREDNWGLESGGIRYGCANTLVGRNDGEANEYVDGEHAAGQNGVQAAIKNIQESPDNSGTTRRAHQVGETQVVWWETNGGNWRCPSMRERRSYGWLDELERHFRLGGVRREENMHAVTVALEGDALSWFRC